ncbi:MAG: hypothetical protein V1774_05420 [Candidatus Eisenbacteria bacterium]
MDASSGDRTAVQALRLGVPPQNLMRMSLPVTLEAETLILSRPDREAAPLIVCLHPARFCEFQIAQRLRDLIHLDAHIAFPRGLYPQDVDLGGARTVGYGWYHYTGDNPAFRRSLTTAVEYVERVMDRLLQGLPVRRDAVFIVGAEDSSLLAVTLAMRHPELICGGAVIDGDLPAELLADLAPPLRRTRFLCIRRRSRRHLEGDHEDPGVSGLRGLGYSVELGILENHDARWHEERDLLLSWFAAHLGLTLSDSVLARPAPPA